MSIHHFSGCCRTLLGLGLLLLLGACGQQETTTTGPKPKVGKGDDLGQRVLKEGSPASIGDGYTISEATVDGDILTLTVSFGGGCAAHDFELYWDQLFLESYPVQAKLVLTHDAHGDMCEAFLTEQLSFDLSKLKKAYQAGYQTEEGTIILGIVEGGPSVTYTFGGSAPAGTPIKEGDPASIGDGYTISEATVDGDILTLTVSFGGGCAAHDFELYWDQVFLESYPVQAKLVLTHDAHGDMCEAFLTEQLTFDLSSLKKAYNEGYQTEEGTIILGIVEGGPSVTYSW